MRRVHADHWAAAAICEILFCVGAAHTGNAGLVFVVPAFLVVYAVDPLGRAERWRAKARLADGLCPCCRYDLTGNVSGICPECGTKVG